jgi:sec-independent protein translocase protein TatB
MDILGVGPGEFLLILILLLVVVGPERLPGLARQAGKMLVSVRNWVQQSPDAAMVLRARQEIEAELANLRESLAEVQSARDEVIEATRQLNQTVNEDVIGATKQSMDEFKQPGTVARSTKPNGVPVTSTPTSPAQANSSAVVAETPAAPAQVNLSDVVAETPATSVVENGVADVPIDVSLGSEPPHDALVDIPSIAPPREPAIDVFEQRPIEARGPDITLLNAKLEALMAEVRQLQEHLQQRGLLNDSWRNGSAGYTNGSGHSNGDTAPTPDQPRQVEPSSYPAHSEEPVHVEQ